MSVKQNPENHYQNDFRDEIFKYPAVPPALAVSALFKVLICLKHRIVVLLTAFRNALSAGGALSMIEFQKRGVPDVLRDFSITACLCQQLMVKRLK